MDLTPSRPKYREIEKIGGWLSENCTAYVRHRQKVKSCGQQKSKDTNFEDSSSEIKKKW